MKFHFRRTEPWPEVSADDWNNWTWQFRNGLKTAPDFARVFDLSDSEQLALKRGTGFQVRTTPYYAAVVLPSQGASDPIRRMIVPCLEELSPNGQQIPDPLGEGKHSPRERLIHRYPDRVLFLVTDQCSLYCRYCLRKHFTGRDQAFVGSSAYERALDYLRGAHGVREVILSGGDPLTLADGRLDRVLSDLRAIDHIELIRIGSRMPAVSPMRVTPDLAKLLRRHKPVYMMAHFNHPQEITHEAAVALETLVDHGVPVLNQMVLLRGINNHAAIVQALSRRLLYLRVKPYYMFQCDPSQGSEHFRTPVSESLAIQRELWGRLSGLAMPNLSLDIPGGGGKVGLTPDFTESQSVSMTEARGSSPANGTASERHAFVGWDGIKGTYIDPDFSDAMGDRVSFAIPTELLRPYLDEWERIKGQGYGVRQ